MADEPVVEKSEGVKPNSQIEALLVERAGYLRMGKTDRAAQVDAQLALRGYSVDAPEAPKATRGQRTTKA